MKRLFSALIITTVLLSSIETGNAMPSNLIAVSNSLDMPAEQTVQSGSNALIASYDFSTRTDELIMFDDLVFRINGDYQLADSFTICFEECLSDIENIKAKKGYIFLSDVNYVPLSSTPVNLKIFANISDEAQNGHEIQTSIRHLKIHNADGEIMTPKASKNAIQSNITTVQN